MAEKKKTFRENASNKPFVDNYEFPDRYNTTAVTLIARDPFSLYAYWETTPSSLSAIKQKIGPAFQKSVATLRMYDVTDIHFNGTNAQEQFDIDLNLKAHHKYIQLQNDNVTWCADLGLKTPKGRFYQLARSNLISTPCADISKSLETTWLTVEHREGRRPRIIGQTPELPSKGLKSVRSMKIPLRPEEPPITAEAGLFREQAAAHAGLAIDLTKTGPFTETGAPPGAPAGAPAGSLYGSKGRAAIHEQLPSSFDSAPSSFDVAPSSGMLHAGASEQLQKEEDFFFQINTDLIIYGRTKPGAIVTIGDSPIELREDGTFTIRRALPDGLFPLAISARSADGAGKKSMVITIEKSTNPL